MTNNPQDPDPQKLSDFALQQLKAGNINPHLLRFLQASRDKLNKDERALLDKYLRSKATPGSRDRTPEDGVLKGSREDLEQIRQEQERIATESLEHTKSLLSRLKLGERWSGLKSKATDLGSKVRAGLSHENLKEKLSGAYQSSSKGVKDFAKNPTVRKYSPLVGAVVVAGSLVVGGVLWDRHNKRLEQLVAQANVLRLEYKSNADNLKNAHDHPFRNMFTNTDKYIVRAVRANDKAVAQGLDDILQRRDSSAKTFTQSKDEFLNAELERLQAGEIPVSDRARFVARRVEWLEDLRLSPWQRLEAQLLRDDWHSAEETAGEIGQVFDASQEARARSWVSGDRKESAARSLFRQWDSNKESNEFRDRLGAEQKLLRAYELINEAKTVDSEHASVYDSIEIQFKVEEREFRVSQFKSSLHILYSSLDRDLLGRNVDVLSLASDLADRINATDLTDEQRTQLSDLHEKVANAYWNRRFDKEMSRASDLAQNDRWDAAYWHIVAAISTQLDGSPSGLELLSKVCTALNINADDYTPKQSQSILDALLNETVDKDSNVGKALALFRDHWKNRTPTVYERAKTHEERVYERQVRVNQHFQRVLTPLASFHRIIYDAGKAVVGTGKGLVNAGRAPFADSVTGKDVLNDFKYAGQSLLDATDATLNPARLAKGAVFAPAEEIPYAGRAFGFVRDVIPLQDPWAEDNSNSRLFNPFGANNGPKGGYEWIQAHYGTAYANAAAIGSVVTNAAITYGLQQVLEGGHRTGGKAPTGPKGLTGGEQGGPRVGPVGQ